MKRFFVVSIFLAVIIIVFGRTFTQFSHYSIKEGLSEINVQSILQDKKGQMWFATFDGLNKFNGYTFKTYKTNPGQLSGLENYRIIRIKEDQKGYLWVQTYDDHIYQFDIQTETFLQVPQCQKEFADYKVRFKNMYTLDDGSVWLAGDDDGCFKVTYDAENHLSIIQFNKNNDLLTSNKINSIYLDSKRNTWILTSNGVNLLKPKSNKPIKLLQEKENGAFLSILENQNYIWLGGEHGKLRYYDLQEESFEVLMIPCPSDIIAIKKITKDELFFLSNHNGFFIYNTVNQHLTAFNKSNGSGLIDDNFFSCRLDKYHNMWLESANPNAVYFQIGGHKITNFFIKPDRTSLFAPNPSFLFNEDVSGNIWVQPRFGNFCRFNPVTNKLDYFYNDPDSPDKRFSSQIHSLYSDRQGNLWVCPYSRGIEKIVFSESPFRFVKPYPSEISSAGNEIRAIYQDNDNRIWAGAKNGIITIYDENFNKIGVLGSDGKINESIPLKASVYAITGDKSGNIWLGSKGDGLFLLSKIGNGHNIRYKINHYTYNANDIYSLSSNNVYSIFEDHLNRIWIATYGGGLNLLEIQGNEIRFISARNKLKNYPIDECFRSRFITENKKGQLLIGTTGGLVVFQADGKKPEDINFYKYTHIPGDKETLSGNDVYSILPASDGKLYLAIFGGGINVLNDGFDFSKRNQIKSFQIETGIPSNIIFTLKEDIKGNIWFTTQTEIGKFNPKNQQFNTYSPLNDNPYVFVEAAICSTRKGEFAYGTSEGFVSFNPQKAVKSSFIPPIVLTNFHLFNKEVEVGVEGSPLKKVIDETKELVLTHKQNIFSISFAALDYTNPQNIQYAYKLDGLEKDWNYVHDQRIATYTNIPKGKYIFRVKSTNADGVWVENERNMLIIKEPSFWESVWGYMFYTLIFLGLVALAIYILYTFFRLRTDVEVEHRMVTTQHPIKLVNSCLPWQG
ncbi:MAG: two-component regulator propeller domain-containing protein, partial [Paludibacter sp.]